VTKDGAGVLLFSGGTANSYAGLTTISLGTLQLGKTSGVTAIAGDVLINSGGTLQLLNNEQIANTSNLTLSGGTFNAGTFSETIRSLTSANAASTVSTGVNSVLTITNGGNYAGSITGSGGVL
jgi:autotransporter-associated beta strand protein